MELLCLVNIHTIKPGDKELFSHPKIVPKRQEPYYNEVNCKLVTGNGSLISICSLLPSLTVQFLCYNSCSQT